MVSGGGRRSALFDRPITRSSEDSLGRLPQAARFADLVASLDASRGFVCAVNGAWGSGKSSFVALVRECLEKSMPDQFEFNPWLFSGSDQLVHRFLTSFGHQLGARSGDARLATKMQAYGALVAGVGEFVPGFEAAFRLAGRLMDGAGTVLEHDAQDFVRLRQDVERYLHDLEDPVLVVLDDVDRLTAAEVRDVFRLVRLVADFPNVVYLLAFDRLVVAAALGDVATQGNEYLEKIVQVAYDLPPVPAHSLKAAIERELNAALVGIDKVLPLKVDRWTQLLDEVVAPLVQTVRGVKRYAMAVRGAALQVGDHVALADLLGLTAIQVFLPSLWRDLVAYMDALTGVPVETSRLASEIEGRRKRQIDELVASAGDHSEVVEAAITLLFPAGARHIGRAYDGLNPEHWWRSRRLANADVLVSLVYQTENSAMRSLVKAEQVLANAGDVRHVSDLLDECPPSELQDLLTSLLRLSDSFTTEHVVPVSTAALNQLLRLPAESRGLMTFDGTIYVRRPVLRLLQLLPGSSEVLRAVSEILPSVTSLAAQLQLVLLVGHREGSGRRLVSEDDAGELESAWRRSVLGASAEQLEAEGPHVLEVVLGARHLGPQGDSAITIDDSNAMTMALLRSAVTESHSQTIGEPATITPQLRWRSLADAVGGVDELHRRVDALDADSFGEDTELFELVHRYREHGPDADALGED